VYVQEKVRNCAGTDAVVLMFWTML